MLSTNTSVRTRRSPANSPRNSPCPSPHGSPRFMRKTDSYRRNRKSVIPVLIVHGGQWGISDSIAELSVESMKHAVNKGYEILMGPEGSVCQAVETAVHYLESDPLLYQGMIGTTNHNTHCDAIMMEGRKLRAGCIVGAKNVVNPIKIAHHLLEKNGQFTLVGDAAEQFAKESGCFEFADPRLLLDNRIDRRKCHELIESSSSKIPKSVGAVAVDSQGRVACAWSSRTYGSGDGIITPLATIGSAAFCDDFIGAVSCCGGYGADAISRVCLARHITGLMQQGGMGTKEAVVAGLEYMQNRINGACGGAVAVSCNGDVGIHFTSDHMAWAYRKGEQMKYGLNPKEFRCEDNAQDCVF